MERTQLTTTPLGGTGLEITQIGLGAWAIGGGDWQFGWGPQDDEESIAAIHEALDRGVNWIDTAGAYGLGHSERVIRRALEGRRERPLLFTKAGVVAGADGDTRRCLERDSVLREVEQSLERLGVDAIDLYQIHWPAPDAAEFEAGWRTFAQLRERGLVRHIGVSNCDVEQLRRLQQIAPVETLQPQYSLIAREVEAEILPFALREGIGVIVYSPMGSGLLTGRMTRERVEALPENDWRARSERFRDPQLASSLALVERLGAVAQRHGVSIGAVATAWTLRNPAVDAAIVGFRRPDQVEPILIGAELALSDDDVRKIEAT